MWKAHKKASESWLILFAIGKVELFLQCLRVALRFKFMTLENQKWIRKPSRLPYSMWFESESRLNDGLVWKKLVHKLEN